MDELIGLALETMRAAKQAKERPQPGYAPDSKYGRMLAELQGRAAAPASGARSVAPAGPPPGAPPPATAAPAPPIDAQNFRSTPRAAAPKATAHDKEEANILRPAPGGSGALQGLFEDGNSLVRAVVAAEVLGPPIALRENPLWQIRRPNERST